MGINRREFLQCMVVAAGTVATLELAGCYGDSETPPASASPPPSVSQPLLSDGTVFFPQSIASGDPREHSVVLWTRLADPALMAAGQDAIVRVHVASDSTFATLVAEAELTAEARFDHCVRVKVTGLDAGRIYFYRFLYIQGSTLMASHTGRTRTAPALNADVTVRFAFASCQDYIGRFYNTYLPLLQPDTDDVHFVVHLGDYIYETTDDPLFQRAMPERAITFSDEAGALQLGEGASTFHAAASLDNYRQLYRTYRADPILQQVHERFPFLVIWDDHEFSNDSWQDHATYLDGQCDEQSRLRKHNAERAWLEYMPIDDTDLAPAPRGVTSILATDDSRLFPHTCIYRDFRFGRHLHLVLTDTRSFRPDHLVPEDAFPGTIVLDEPTLSTALGASTMAAIRGTLAPYIDVNALDPLTRGTLQALVQELFVSAGLTATAATARTAQVLQSRIDVNYANALLQGAPGAPRIDPTPLQRGISFALLGKQSLFSSLGSRTNLVQPMYDLFAGILAAHHDEDVLGQEQETWFHHTLRTSTATWKVIGHSVSNTSLVLDLTQNTVPPEHTAAWQALIILRRTPLAQRYYLNVDQWDGFPTRRAALLNFLRQSVPNAVLLAGDIHAAFVTDHTSSLGPLFEFTITSVSSETLREGARTLVNNDALLCHIPGINALLAQFDRLLDAEITSPTVQQRLLYCNTGANGVARVEVNRQEMIVTYFLLPAAAALTSYYANPTGVLTQLDVQTFRIRNRILSAV